MFTTRRCILYSPVRRHELKAKKGHASKEGLGTNSIGLAIELSLVSKLLQKVIPNKIFAGSHDFRQENTEHSLAKITPTLQARYRTGSITSPTWHQLAANTNFSLLLAECLRFNSQLLYLASSLFSFSDSRFIIVLLKFY